MPGKTIGWIDLLRVIACFLVVLSHCCDPFVGQLDNDRTAFLTGAFIGSLVRSCVPLFVMMSGVLLFPVHASLGEFYRKRIGRILPPLIFWSVALPVLFYVYLNYIYASESPNIQLENFTLTATWTKIYTFIFNFNYDTTPLWYLYMLLGLYFVIPVFSNWLEHSSSRDIRLFLYIWGISLFLPYLKMIAPLLGYTGNGGNPGLFGVCDWNEYGTFYYVSGFIGYLVLAYYLIKYPLNWSRKRILSVCIPMFILGYLITSIGFVLVQKYSPGDYVNFERVWYFTGINVFLMTFPVFVIVQNLKIPASPWLSRLASATFGIYLCHFVFVQAIYDLLATTHFAPVIRIPITACIAFVISYLLIRLMSSFKLTRRLVL